jgi:hypothetical protein
VKTPVDARLVADAARFSFRFACDDCAHFAPEADACGNAWPVRLRRSAIDPAPLVESVAFCKEFELG